MFDAANVENKPWNSNNGNECTILLCSKKKKIMFLAIIVPSFNSLDLPHNITHYIITHGFSVNAYTRYLASRKLKIAKVEFNEMLNLGIIRSSKSNQVSPLHMVSPQTRHDQNNLRKQLFTKLDLIRAHYQRSQYSPITFQKLTLQDRLCHLNWLVFHLCW